MTSPPKPSGGPEKSWEHRKLYDDVKRALFALPERFESEIRIYGIDVIDLFTMNTALGAAIEKSVVASLNNVRSVWDPEGHYQSFSFQRFSQSFPDVRLCESGRIENVLLGIELKGWFVLAKEGEPSFRYKVTPDACNPQDLLAVFPWSLSEVVSGQPVLLAPEVVEARYAALYRNYYWQNMRGVDAAKAQIKAPPNPSPYPLKADAANDIPFYDSGGNYGRLARGGFFNKFIESTFSSRLAGIEAKYWHKFIKSFTESASPADLEKRLGKLNELASSKSADKVDELIGLLVDMLSESNS